MSDEWNWGQDPKKTDDTPRQSDSDVSRRLHLISRQPPKKI